MTKKDYTTDWMYDVVAPVVTVAALAAGALLYTSKLFRASGMDTKKSASSAPVDDALCVPPGQKLDDRTLKSLKNSISKQR